MTALDLSDFSAALERQEAGTEIDILGMDEKTPIGLKIRVAGPDSQRATKATEELTDDLIEKQQAGRVKASEAKQRGIRYLARITLGWAPAVKLDGQELQYSVENAERLYTKFRFIRDQVDKAAVDRARFTEG